MMLTYTDPAGTQYILDINHNELFFGAVLVGDVSAQKILTLTNRGWGDISLRELSITGDGFSMLDDASGVILKPGEDASFAVTFTPFTKSTASGSIFIDAGIAGTANIRLYGAGYSGVDGDVDITGMRITPLFTDLATEELLNLENGTKVWVYNDPVLENIGFYEKNGASGTGSYDGPYNAYSTMMANFRLDAEAAQDVVSGAVDLNGTGTVTTRDGLTLKTLSRLQQDFNDTISAVEAAADTAVTVTIPGYITDVQTAAETAENVTIPGYVDDAQAAVAAGVAVITDTVDETVNSIIPGYAETLFASIENTVELAATAVAETAANVTATAEDRAAIEGMMTELDALPYSAVSQDQLYDAGGSINLNGTGMPLPDSDSNIAIAPRSGANTEAMRGAETTTSKAVAIGPYAFQYFSGYDSTGIGWRAGRWGGIDNGIIIGVHAGEKSNTATRNIWGFGTRASGNVTFTGLPSDGDTVTIAGVVFTAKTARAVAGEFTIGATATATVLNLFQEILLVSQTNNALKNLRFRANAAILNIEAEGTGTYGNAVTLAESSANITVSGATLTGGTTLTSSKNKQHMFSAILIGVAAGKRADPVYSRKAHGTVRVTGIPSVGATLTIGIGTAISGAAATGKTFTWVASGGGGGTLNVNQGTDVASSIANLVTALEEYKAANPTFTALSTVNFWASHRGLEVEYTTVGTAGNTYRIKVTGNNLSSPRRFLAGGINANYNSGPIMLGANSESHRGANVVSLGVGAMSSSEAIDTIAIGSNSGTGSRGANNIYLWASGQNITGSNNHWFGQALGGAATGSYVFITSVTALGVVTFSQPFTDPMFRVGAKVKFIQRNNVLGTDLIKANGTNIANILATVISDNQILIDDFLDADDTDGGAVYTGGTVYSVGTATNVELAPIASQCDWSTSWGDAPESGVWHAGATNHTKVEVRAEALSLPNNRYLQAGVNYGAVAATGKILFATAQGNFADGDTVTLNGIAFTAKTAAAFATPNTLMVRWFRIGADMYESLENLIRAINRSDDNSASSRAVKVATFWLSGATGSGWNFNVRADRVLSTGNNFTLATSKAGATVTAMSGGSIGTLPNALSASPPYDGEERALSNWLSGRAYATWDAALGDWRVSAN